MSVRGDFVDALVASLAAELRLPFEVGRVEDGQDQTVGCVWFEGKRPMGRDGNVEENYYRIRLFHGHIEPTESVHQHLLTDLETLEAALKAILTTAGHWFFNVLEITPDYDRHCVDAQLTAYDDNRSAAGG